MPLSQCSVAWRNPSSYRTYITLETTCHNQSISKYRNYLYHFYVTKHKLVTMRSDTSFQRNNRRSLLGKIISINTALVFRRQIHFKYPHTNEVSNMYTKLHTHKIGSHSLNRNHYANFRKHINRSDLSDGRLFLLFLEGKRMLLINYTASRAYP